MDDLIFLVTEARGGNLEAYGTIVRRFQDMACGYAYAILADFHAAEDAAQEAFVEAYLKLGDLRVPKAFPGWLRRIVFKHCDRLARRSRTPSLCPEALDGSSSTRPGPDHLAEDREMREAVLEAIRSLPEDERTVTTLFYINGYSQSEVAEFLELPVTTVNGRLRTARKRLRERMVDMVDETLKSKAPDERFSKRVIDMLLARPNLLEIEGHPVRQAWDEIRKVLREYEIVSGNEVESAETFAAAEDHSWDQAYRLDDKALRYQTTTVTMTAIRGRRPPVKLLTAGRVFRPDREDAEHSRVFHQVDGVCVASGVGVSDFHETCERVLKASNDSMDIRWRKHDYGFVTPGFTAVVVDGGRELEILGGGMLKPETLLRAGHDPASVAGFAWGLSLERIVMLKLGIKDIRELWRSPWVT